MLSVQAGRDSGTSRVLHVVTDDSGDDYCKMVMITMMMTMMGMWRLPVVMMLEKSKPQEIGAQG